MPKTPKKINEEYFKENFNTPLSNEDEKAFQRWLGLQNRLRGRDVSKDLSDYDLRGYWSNIGFRDTKGHSPDTYKKPNHPTFSNESIYHGTDSPFGKWEGGRWGEGSFTPSKAMLEHTHNMVDLAHYFKFAEPDYKLKMPEE